MLTAILGAVFLVVGFATMFLMYHLWGYPFDKATRTSAAPKWAMLLHRLLGYLFVLIYVGLMVEMVPRLWQYQVEFPARTTVHITLGFTIGFLLLVKIAIMRFFRHFEEWMPYLGTAIMLGTVIMLGLSLPFAFQDRLLASRAPKGNVTSKESLARVAAMLPTAEFADGVKLADLATAEAIREGHRVLVTACVRCHDLRTILLKPRTPSGWREVVDRMAEKPTVFEAIPKQDLQRVTAYLIAITPDLAKSSAMKREAAVAKAGSLSAALAVEQGSAAPDVVAGGAVSTGPIGSGSVDATPATGSVTVKAANSAGRPAASTGTAPSRARDLAEAKQIFQNKCSQCHDIDEVARHPPKSTAQTSTLIKRMIEENDAVLSASEIRLISAYMNATYVK